MDTCIHACHSAYRSQSTSCMELIVSIRSVDSRDQIRPIKLGAAASSLKALCCSKNAINGRLLFQTFVWWKDLLHTNADSLGLTESQSDNLSGFCYSLIWKQKPGSQAIDNCSPTYRKTTRMRFYEHG